MRTNITVLDDLEVTDYTRDKEIKVKLLTGDLLFDFPFVLNEEE